MSAQTVLITGGATGIGLATTTLFVSRGARVAAGYLEAGGSLAEVLWVQADLRDEQAIHRMVERVLGEFGRIDVLVNCASRTGMSAVAPFLEASTAHVDDVISTNLRGTVLVSQAVARAMVQAGTGGSIIHVASVGAITAQEHASVYCATKAAQVALAKAMALELAPHHIRVNCVSPGDVQTQASETIVADLKAAGSSGKYIRQTPLGRRGRPEEIAAAIAWLASPESSFVTGTNLVVDGGFLAY